MRLVACLAPRGCGAGALPPGRGLQRRDESAEAAAFMVDLDALDALDALDQRSGFFLSGVVISPKN